MSGNNLNNLITDHNGGAYEKEETRVGLPLDYVASKQRQSLENIHYIEKQFRSNKDDYFFMHYAFSSGIKAFLALYNMLALTNDNQLYDRLLAYTDDEFEGWLNNIEKHGCVNG
jgi:hypothetical protein